MLFLSLSSQFNNTAIYQQLYSKGSVLGLFSTFALEGNIQSVSLSSSVRFDKLCILFQA